MKNYCDIIYDIIWLDPRNGSVFRFSFRLFGQNSYCDFSCTELHLCKINLKDFPQMFPYTFIPLKVHLVKVSYVFEICHASFLVGGRGGRFHFYKYILLYFILSLKLPSPFLPPFYLHLFTVDRCVANSLNIFILNLVKA